VRSSRREVVLGLTIGLSLSMLLAAAGQAYLREDVIANTHRGPEAIETLTLSARAESGATSSAAPLPPNTAEQPAISKPEIAKAEPAKPAATKPAATKPAAAKAETAKPATANTERAGRIAPRASPARERTGARRSPLVSSDPPLFEVEKPLSEAPHERAPMSPAESAGLGLDLPL
jgi:hypothetical protein